jgi:cell division GTPase FtsZ
MNVLLLSSGGGGGNILRSLKTLFAKDVATAHKTDAKYAERLRRAIATRFLDTNEFSLAQVPKEERVLIGAATTKRLGSRHSPELAERALEESRHEVERLIAKYSVIVIVGTGGKGTGAGTMFPLAQVARRQNKLVLPVFVRPSFERHEVDKRRYDHAIRVAEQFDAAGIRLIEILNDRAYSDTDPQPQSTVWERMNLPIARGLRGLLYVLWDLSQVDPSDLSILLAGHGRMRIGFAEIDPIDNAEPSETQIAEAVRGCWNNTYCAFSKPVGTSLVCIQGEWSNLVDAKIKGGLAALALGETAGNPYNPLYARAFQTPKPWGVTALFTEHTGVHEPLALEWSVKMSTPAIPSTASEASTSEPTEHAAAVAVAVPVAETAAPLSAADSLAETAVPGAERRADDVGTEARVSDSAVPVARVDGAIVETAPVAPTPQTSRAVAADRRVAQPIRGFETVWEFARALNRSDRAALRMAADEREPELPIDGLEVKRLLGTFWFRSVFPQLSGAWRERLLDALTNSIEIPNHVMRLGRQGVRLSDLRYAQLKEISAKTLVRGAAGTDLQLLVAIGHLWGDEAFSRLRFVDIVEREESSRFAALLGLRG